MDCHFVYSVPYTENNYFIKKIIKKVQYKLHYKGIISNLLDHRQFMASEFDSWPVVSPYENTKNIYIALNSKCPTHLYHLTERIKLIFKPDDIFIGHPIFPFSANSFGVTELAVKNKCRPKICSLITPLHCNTSINTNHINLDYLKHIDSLMPYVDILFAIMGEYWWKKWDFSPFAHWKNKMVRLDMAVNTCFYPRVKTTFNKPGKRGYLYIGSSEPQKNTGLLSKLMDELGSYPRGWIGSGPDIPNVPRISQRRSLTPEFMKTIADTYDFFVNTSIADANPTTILESMAWGFPVICTPQSGYYETPYRRNIFIDDVHKSLAVLNDLQYTDETELCKMADEARAVVENTYTWDKFTSSIIAALGI